MMFYLQKNQVRFRMVLPCSFQPHHDGHLGRLKSLLDSTSLLNPSTGRIGTTWVLRYATNIPFQVDGLQRPCFNPHWEALRWLELVYRNAKEAKLGIWEAAGDARYATDTKKYSAFSPSEFCQGCDVKKSLAHASLTRTSKKRSYLGAKSGRGYSTCNKYSKSDLTGFCAAQSTWGALSARIARERLVLSARETLPVVWLCIRRDLKPCLLSEDLLLCLVIGRLV